MDRRLLHYLPPVLRDVLEFQVINSACQPEIAMAWEALEQVLANQFLEDADESGVAVWETELSLRPKDTDTLDIRKARIRALWNLELPYTEPWLRSWLDQVCGAGAYTLRLRDYTISLELDFLGGAGLLEEAAEKLRQVCPANMALHFEQALQSSPASVRAAAGYGGMRMSIYAEVKHYGLG